EGAALNDDIVYSSYIGYDGRVDLEDIERIEVVRGAGSVLYGTGAFSGVVNLVLRRPPPGGHVALSTAEGGIARLRAGYAMKLGQDGGVWLSLAGARAGGRTMTMANDWSEGSGPVDVRAVDAFEAGTVTGRLWHGDWSAQWLLTGRGQDIPAGAYETRLGEPGTRFVDERALLEVRYEPRLSSRVRMLSRVHGNSYGFDGTYSYPDDTTAVEEFRGLWVGGEARVVVDVSRRLRLTVGSEGQWHAVARMLGNFDDGTTSEAYLDEDQPFELGAGYALLEGEAFPWLRFSAGARLDYYSTFGSSINPRLAVIVRPREGDVVKLFAGRAFRAPSVYELYYNDGGETQVASGHGGYRLSPEVGYSAELEYLHRFNETSSIAVTAYGGWSTGIIETVPVNPEEDLPFVYRNSDVAIATLGGDLELRREWRRGWMLAASYGYLWTRSREPHEDGAMVNARVPNAPEHFAAVRSIMVLVPEVAVLAARMGLEAPRRINLSSEDVTDAALVADLVLSGGVRRAGVRYTVGVYNLFDWRYQVPVSDAFPVPIMPQAGRSFMASVARDF
ncbi:MAG: TonB-dependent receptor, partial [Pseudomonadota bacterium]